MQSDDLVQDTGGRNNPTEKMIKRKIEIKEAIWRELGDRAEAMDLTREQYIELAHASLCQEDTTVKQYQSMLISASNTIEEYRRQLEYAGVDINHF